MSSPSNPSFLPALKTKPKYIFFSDFDGTITSRDSNDFMADTLGYGPTKRQASNSDILHGRSSFRHAFKSMLDSIPTPYDQCIQVLLEHITLDPGFKDFYQWSREHNIPVVILSGGMEPMIRALLVHLIGSDAEDIQIISSSVVAREGKHINEEGGWEIAFRDDSHFGHDKSVEIRKYFNLPHDIRPILFYAGDGVSDLSAAKETDLLFAKKDRDLIQYCIRESIHFTEFADWSDIWLTVRDIVAGRTDVERVALEAARMRDEGQAQGNGKGQNALVLGK